MAEGGGQRVAASSRVPSVRFREIDASRAGLAALERFYRERYVAEFPDPDERESLDNMRRYLLLKAQVGTGATTTTSSSPNSTAKRSGVSCSTISPCRVRA